jgi:tetratricopeptide (TPR) repeat protein
MSRVKGTTVILTVTLLSLLVSEPKLHSQTQKSTPAAATGLTLTTEKALTLAEQGRCKEALPALKRASSGQGPVDTRKRAGAAALRCALTLDDRDSAAEIARTLYKQFNDDPDILFMIVHAYSDLSTRAAQDLGRKAPQSIPAHKLNAEALEMQGRWDDALHEYEVMIEKNPDTPGLHFLAGRSLLSRPDADAKTAERAKKEIEIDPKNPVAHYVLGELASKERNWDEAIVHFSQAAKLDPNFPEAHLDLGLSLITVRRYGEAIAPLRIAERLTPGNPAVHYGLATALNFSGQKEEAEKELAIHERLTSSTPTAPTPAPEKPQ